MKFFFFLLLFASQAALAQTNNFSEAYEKRMFIRNGDTLLYRLLTPMKMKAGEKYPVVTFLHGSGERGNDNELQLTHGGKLFADTSLREKFPAYVIFPQCPLSASWTNFRRKSKDGVDSEKDQNEILPEPKPLQLAKMLIDSFAATPQVNDNRLYIGGLSLGGFGTFEILQGYPNTFAAAFPICGGGDPQDAGKYAKQVDLWVFHGGQDNVVPPQLSRDMVHAIKIAGGDVKYSEYPEAATTVGTMLLPNRNCCPGCFQLKKNSQFLKC